MCPDSLYLRQNIAKIENKYPEDNIITTYKDYLKERPFLLFYQFNPKVFFSILKIGVENLEKGKKVSKLSLVVNLYKYLELAKEKQNFPDGTAALMMRLLKQVHSNPPKNFITQQRLVGKITWLLRGLRLNEGDIKYLIGLVDVYRSILIFVLRYQYKTPVITVWANDNSQTDRYREYRTELISWLLDEDPGYEVDTQVLKDDFDYANERDRKILQDYMDEIEAIKLLGMTIHKVFPEPDIKSFFEYYEPFTNYTPEMPELKLTKRPYPVPIDTKVDLELRPFRYVYDYTKKEYRGQRVHIPNFKSLESRFRSDFDEIYRKTMIYAIMFSRWGMNEKISLLERYYSKDWFYTFQYIAVQIKSVEMLKWLIEKE